jgi:hypothetical protein
MVMNAPFYVSETNTLTPLVNINVVQLFIIIWNILHICVQILFFIIKEIFVEAFTNLTFEKVVYVIVIYNLFMLVVTIDNQDKKSEKLKEQIDLLEKQMGYLKKVERMREEMDELLAKDIRLYLENTNNLMQVMENKIKKVENNLRLYK